MGGEAGLCSPRIGYAAAMNELERLQAAANRKELAISRRLARQSGMPLAQALHATLTASAGADSLPGLLARRDALRAQEAARLEARHNTRAQAAAERRGRHQGPSTGWRAWFDGSARPNPGRCAIGALLRGPDGELVELSRAAGHGNSSEAEYLALIAVLEAALAHGATRLTVFGDSQVVIDDVNGPQDAGAGVLRAYRLRVQALLARLPGVTLRWIPRHRNGEADALSQRACGMDRDDDAGA